VDRALCSLLELADHVPSLGVREPRAQVVLRHDGVRVVERAEPVD